jgi:hypothetical protein
VRATTNQAKVLNCARERQQVYHEFTFTIRDLSIFSGLPEVTVKNAVDALSDKRLAVCVGSRRHNAQVWAFDRVAPLPIDERGITRMARESLQKALDVLRQKRLC